MTRFISILLMALAVLNAGHVGAFEFTDDTAIVIPERARESTELGARELAEYVKKISGTELIVQTGPSAKRNRVFIGTLVTLKNIPPAVRRRLEDTDNIEAFCIYTEKDGALPGRGETLWIVGKKYVAELWGVYALLEEQLGVRWMTPWTPEDPGEYVPKLARIKLEALNIFRQPRFNFRKLAFVAAAPTPMAVHGQNLAVRNKFHIHRPWNFDRNFDEPYYMARVNLPQDGGHNTLVRAIPPETCFEMHPEYFALLDGKRVSGHQYCLANPEVHKLLFRHYHAKAEKFGPENFDFLFGMIDVTYGWCECELCRRMDETEEWDPRNVSTRFHKVASKVSAQILETYPDTIRFQPAGTTAGGGTETIMVRDDQNVEKWTLTIYGLTGLVKATLTP